ncbi:MAG: hypothetical protein V2I33_25905 [Kangiellaceae bacterium]|jgi:hypothetical protein|nr:hypothetical protein [Kangiellaceae bacterium]
MARLIKRMGTLAQKYLIDIVIHSIKINLKLPVTLTVTWKRRNKRLETTGNAYISPDQSFASIDESLSMVNTLYQKKSNG